MTHCDAVWALTLPRGFIPSLRGSHRSQIVPLLILHSDADPIELVVEVLVSVVYPGPDLLLYIARKLIS